MVSTPDAPAGENGVVPGKEYTYKAAGARSNRGHSLQYQFDWGDDSTSDWSSQASASHGWAKPGQYSVRVRARSAFENEVVSDWSALLTVNTHCAVAPAIPTGPDESVTSTDCSFSTGGQKCSLGHTVEYQFDWGDGTSSEWSSTGSASHSWSEEGDHVIKSRSRCTLEHDVVSPWSAGHEVRIAPPHSVSRPTVPSGPTDVVKGKPYSYSTGGAESNRGSQVEYKYDWGDGTESGWSIRTGVAQPPRVEGPASKLGSFAGGPAGLLCLRYAVEWMRSARVSLHSVQMDDTRER